MSRRERQIVMKSVLIRIKHYRPNASIAEQGVLDYILANPDAVAESNIHRLAELAYCSSSTIVRLCRKLGFEGYRDLRKALMCELVVRNQNREEKGQHIEHSNQLSDIINKITYRNIASLEDSMCLIEAEDVQKCVDLIYQCDTVLLFGMGASQLVAQDAFMKFQRVNKRCFCCSDVHSQYIQAKNATANDVAIVISYSGCTEEMLRCARDLQAHGTPIIAITRFIHSPLTQLASYCLYVVATEELFRSGAMSSRIAQLNVIDILYTSFINRDFASNIQRLETNQLVKLDNR